MGKFTLFITGFYFCYYAGNMVYDLFLKKDTVIKNEEAYEFSLEEFVKQNQVSAENVTIEDVENLTMPGSFNKSELFPDNGLTDKRDDLDKWREKFESEQNIEDFQSEDFQTSAPLIQLDKLDPAKESNEIDGAEKYSSFSIDKNKEKFKNLLNLAETSVQLIAHPDGYKVYYSII